MPFVVPALPITGNQHHRFGYNVVGDFKEMLRQFGFEDSAIFLYKMAGLHTLHNICALTYKGLSELNKSIKRTNAGKAVFPIVGQTRLTIALFYVQTKCNQGSIPTCQQLLENFTYWSDFYRNVKEGGSTRADVSMPGTFSTKLGWKKWVKSLENWCSSIKGENHIPLTYLIRDLDTPRDPRLPFSTEFERQRECTPHQGSAFKEDNNSL